MANIAMNLFALFLILISLTNGNETIVTNHLDHKTNSVPGGLALRDQLPTQEIQELIRQLSPKIKTHLMGVPGGIHIRGDIIPISYKTQLVNGVNYFVKVKAQTSQKIIFYHLRIFKSFDGNARLIKVAGPKRMSDAISYF